MTKNEELALIVRIKKMMLIVAGEQLEYNKNNFLSYSKDILKNGYINFTDFTKEDMIGIGSVEYEHNLMIPIWLKQFINPELLVIDIFNNSIQFKEIDNDHRY